jgi:hypothetical protein
LRNFDRIVVLQAGRVCEDGPPQVLVRSKGVYCNLVRREVARLTAVLRLFVAADAVTAVLRTIATESANLVQICIFVSRVGGSPSVELGARSWNCSVLRTCTISAARLLQIDGLVAAVLVELGAPYFVRALMLGWTEADERPQTHVEITHGF